MPAVALSLLLGACAVAVAATPQSATFDIGASDEDLSLLQVRPAALTNSISSKRDWPNPADPNAQPNIAQKMIIANLKLHPHNKKILNATISSIALTPVSYVVKVGGYKILFDALHYFANDSTVQMNCWRGLSDQSHTEIGSRHINDYGGRNEGMKYMVEQLTAHPKPREAECRDHLTYAYEVLQCVSGLLQWDVNGTRAVAAVEAGLLEQLAHVMRIEMDFRPTMDVCCTCLAFLLERNASYATRLGQLGVKELAQDAVDRYSAYDPTPFYFGTTYGNAYPVAPTCRAALTHF